MKMVIGQLVALQHNLLPLDMFVYSIKRFKNRILIFNHIRPRRRGGRRIGPHISFSIWGLAVASLLSQLHDIAPTGFAKLRFDESSPFNQAFIVILSMFLNIRNTFQCFSVAHLFCSQLAVDVFVFYICLFWKLAILASPATMIEFWSFYCIIKIVSY